ncbi:Proteasome Maturation Protein 37 [Trypanosoma brucei equiperdum]|uniref:Proteasome Maturation Protein 37 n=1 Tax=Trypanosoma brucei equiperdum TaxID=630700 RepID=A0A3L6L533_9TRYP|nr:Proteasome Maturation Protein 37 [Trypanosoma brucei equiperdum]
MSSLPSGNGNWSADIIRTASKVDAVTMYKGQAHVRRYAKIKLPFDDTINTSPRTPANTPVASTDVVDQMSVRDVTANTRDSSNSSVKVETDAGSYPSGVVEPQRRLVNEKNKEDLEEEEVEGREVHIYFAMPPSFDQDSVQVRFDAYTSERVLVCGVFFENIEEDPATDGSHEGVAEDALNVKKDLRTMEAKLERVVRKRAVNKLQQEELNHGVDIATNLFDRACGPLTDELADALVTDFWKMQIDGVEERTRQYLKEKRRLQSEDTQLEKEEMDIERQIELMNRRIFEVEGERNTALRWLDIPDVEATSTRESSAPAGRHRFCCIVVRTMERILESTVFVLYISHDASWRCEYEVALDSQKREVTLQYNAVVSGGVEDFDDVALTLSSAAPRRHAGRGAKLKPWRLEVSGVNSCGTSSTGNAKEGKPAGPFGDASGESSDSSDDEQELPDEPWNVAGNEDGPGGVMNFTLPGRYSIRALTRSAVDAQTELRVPIATRRWEAEVNYVTVPGVSEAAYATATCTNEGTNDSEGALLILAGKASVQLDGDFVANSMLERTPPGEKLRIYFGVDPSIEVRRDFLTKKHDDADKVLGFSLPGSNGRSRVTYSYTTTLTNKKPMETVTLTLREHIPKSDDKELVVQLIEPANYAVDDEEKRRGFETEGEVNIEVVLKPGESRRVDFSFMIDAPRKSRIYGL